MTAETKAREKWKEAISTHGKGSPEDLSAYREYMKIHQGETKCRNGRKTRRRKDV